MKPFAKAFLGISMPGLDNRKTTDKEVRDEFKVWNTRPKHKAFVEELSKFGSSSTEEFSDEVMESVMKTSS